MIGLTPKQAAVLGYIRRFAAAQGRVPLLREIGAEFGYKARSGPREMIASLVERVRLTYTGQRTPSYALVPDGGGLRPVAIMDGFAVAERGTPAPYTGPFPMRGVTCADFGADGVLHAGRRVA